MKLSNLQNMRLGKQLAVGLGLLMVPVIVVAAVVMGGSSSRDRANAEIDRQYGETLLGKDFSSIGEEVQAATWRFLETRDPATAAARKEELNGLRESQSRKLAALEAAVTTEAGQRLLAEIRASATATRLLGDQVVELVAQGKREQAMTAFLAKESTVQGALRQATQDLIARYEKRIREAHAAAEAAKSSMTWLIVLGTVLILVVMAVVGVSLTRSVTRPIAASSRLIEATSRGDLTNEIPASLLARGDEAGELAAGTARLVTTLRTSLLGVVNGVGTLGATAEGLQTISHRLTEGATVTSERMQAVATAAEESSSNTTSIASSMEEASTNLSSVAAAAEQMSATVGEIAANSEKARVISVQAVGEVQSMGSIMRQLGQAAQEIGKVTETITRISAQTNLLALNATIEAARAGMAGKGFAVVANEIKDLAGQTGAATEDIRAKIGSVQDSAAGAIASIERISGVIKDVGEIVSSIATAIEEQATVTKNVAGNVAEASAGIRDANERVAQTASVSRTMAEDIARVNSEGEAMRRESSIVAADITGLRMVREQLLDGTWRFRIGENLGDFAAIKQGHIRCRGKLLEMFDGQVTLDEGEIRNHHVCAFGKWYEGAEGQRFCHLPSHGKLGERHQAFHALVGDIVGLWKGGKEDEALKRYETLLQRTGELFALLDDLALEAVKMAA